MANETFGSAAAKMRVAVADPLTLCREGLVSLLAAYPHVTVAGSSASGSAVHELCRDAQPDVLILASSLAGEMSIQQFEAIQSQAPGTKVLLLADESSRLAPGPALSLAKGFLRRHDSMEHVLKALAAVVSGKVWEAPQVPGPAPRATKGRGSVLSNRESDIATLVSQGMSNREIAERLGLSEQSVKNLVSRILKKLGLNNRVQIAMRCWKTQ
jgi:DNA-binding NarL/FixJ family response regulator